MSSIPIVLPPIPIVLPAEAGIQSSRQVDICQNHLDTVVVVPDAGHNRQSRTYTALAERGEVQRDDLQNMLCW